MTILQNWQLLVVGVIAAGAAFFLIRRVYSAMRPPQHGTCDKCSPGRERA